MCSNPYQRQKSALELQLSQGLGALSSPRTVTSCTANDIVKFLISKDKSGRTEAHSSSCPRASCTSQKCLAAGSVDSLMSRLRTIFNNLGRLNDSNPVAHPLVKRYLKLVWQEQASLGITPAKAVPLVFDKFRRLIAFLRGRCVHQASLSRAGKYILTRDATFFVLDFFTGDRASDIGRLQSRNVFKLSFSGLLSRRIFARVLPALSPWFNLFTLKFALLLGFYITLRFASALESRWTKDTFGVTERNGSEGNKPFTGSAVSNRLRKHLLEFKLHAGETPRSFRMGLSNTLILLGCSQEDVAQYLG